MLIEQCHRLFKKSRGSSWDTVSTFLGPFNAHPMCCKLKFPANTAATPVLVLDLAVGVGMV